MTGRRRIDFLVHDLSSNAIVRAAPFIRACQHDYAVTVIGVRSGAVFRPFADAFPMRSIRSAGIARQCAIAPLLARHVRGDLVVACKPLLTTLLPALLAGGRPVLLDVEDDERASPSASHRFFARIAHPLVGRADAVVVGTDVLMRRYGGTLIRHGPSVAAFTGRRADRARFGLPENRKLALFAGTPRRHKGWDVLLEALLHTQAAQWDLVAAGELGPALHGEAAARLGQRFHKLRTLPNEEMPDLLAVADAVPVPQLDEPYPAAQVPAKALEAIAAGVPVVASRVGDLPEILGSERGWLIPAAAPEALANALAEIARDPAEARRRAERARLWFAAEASEEALRQRFLPIVERLMARGRE